ncbi:MAG: HlyD family efflux transporter periplasmic adaptor subunit, partial [Aliifodinibius sp.]|nr:HlyD family efflux transporter periplasmic adaptor subunit [candidate division Zixibacteria bacterium]NIT59548.1 HlyD family efflux transporter periplasmic adaptor subunit [Fodinibius sp.]NIW41227.1 HlyD family efflux transporter periplasmic adaptor subunit [candidate division Zixibacteria bacterium]NIX56049.1 HlyD family efflux transporter periplasmic adaptor subunit [candidate division Zixibacteria bacterium]NIY28131.1 HlyD family efflux transporter periplasmic adaptor subunit [Fodinibius 
MKKVIGLIVIVAVIGILIVLIIINQQNELAPDPPGIVTATGTIEITEIDISPQLSGKILELNKVRGEKADSLELLAKIDAKELRARLDEIDSRFKMINAQIEQARIQLENLNRNLKRTEKALEAGAATQSQYDEVLTQRDYTKQQIETLKTQIINLQAQKEVLLTQISNSEISSPASGWITSKNMEEGELAMPGVPIYTLSLLEDAYINVYVNETRIGEINLHDSAYVTIDTYPDRNFKGYVEFISPEAEFTPKNIQTKEERVKLVFEVRINLDNPDHILKPGLPADV